MPEDSKTLLRRFYGEVSNGNLDVIDEVLADDFVDHEEVPGLEPTKEGVKQFFAMFRSAFPDMRMEPHEILADGDLLSARGTMTGTQQGEFMGMPATGKRIETDVFDVLRFRDGQLTEHWGLMDVMKMMKQLGATPAQIPA